MKLAYLLSEYSPRGHTYLLREVRQLRALRWDIQTISIRLPSNTTSSLSPAEGEDVHSTWCIAGSGLIYLLREPCGYVSDSSVSLFTWVGDGMAFLGVSAGEFFWQDAFVCDQNSLTAIPRAARNAAPGNVPEIASPTWRVFCDTGSWSFAVVLLWLCFDAGPLWLRQRRPQPLRRALAGCQR